MGIYGWLYYYLLTFIVIYQMNKVVRIETWSSSKTSCQSDHGHHYLLLNSFITHSLLTLVVTARRDGNIYLGHLFIGRPEAQIGFSIGSPLSVTGISMKGKNLIIILLSMLTKS